MEPEAGAGRDAPAAMGEIRFAGENLSHKGHIATHRGRRKEGVARRGRLTGTVRPTLDTGSGARAGRREQGREQGCSRCYGLAVAPEAAASAVAHYLGEGPVAGRDERPRSSAWDERKEEARAGMRTHLWAA